MAEIIEGSWCQGGIYLVEGESLNVDVIRLTLWASICGHDGHRPGIGISIAATLSIRHFSIHNFQARADVYFSGVSGEYPTKTPWYLEQVLIMESLGVTKHVKAW